MRKITLPILLIPFIFMQNCIRHESGGVSTDNIVLYSTQLITEEATNVGDFDATITATLKGSNFSELLVDGTDFGTKDLPDGLTVEVTRDAPNKASIHIFGQATTHSFCSNGSMSFFFKSTAFSDGQLPISFEFPITVQYISPALTYSGHIFTEDSATNNGTINDTITVTTQNGGTFSQSSGVLVEGTDYEWLSLPTGLTSVVTLNSATQATISFTGTVTNNTPLNDAVAKFKFLSHALSSEFCATLPKKEMDFTMYRSVIIYAVNTDSGDLTGMTGSARAGADALCTAGAPTGLPDDYTGLKAFISTTGTDEIQDLFDDQGGDVPHDVIFESTNGSQVATDRDDLLDGTITQDLDTADVTTGPADHIWTGSDATGAIATGHVCDGGSGPWTDATAGFDGEVGISNDATGGNYLDTTTPDTCDTADNQLLCIAYVAQ